MVWAMLLVVGLWMLFSYANKPGESAIPRFDWPRETKISRDPELATLLVFTHPKCACSEATLGELERLLPHIKDKVRSVVIFVRPKTTPHGFAEDKLWSKANSIPAVRVLMDADGVEADRFGARTSGQVFLYAPDGSLLFQGGITPARNHMGDSDGRAAILNYVKSNDATYLKANVFGCSLKERHGPERAIAEEKHAVQ